MAVEAVAAVAAKEVVVEAAKEAALQAAREIAQKAVDVAGTGKNDIQTAMMERQAIQEGFRIGEMPDTKGDGREVLKEKEASVAEELRGKYEGEEDFNINDLSSKSENLDTQPFANTEVQQSEEKVLESSEKQDILSDSFIEKTDNNIENITNDNAEGAKQLPKENGEWGGERGNSEWKPSSEYVPLKSNPEGKNWKEIFKNEATDKIKFNSGEPDFSPFSRETVEIDDFTDSRPDNFSQADQALAERYNNESYGERNNWNCSDIEKMRGEQNLTWHERSNMKTMDLVPSEIHNNVQHSGGISVARQLAA